MDVGTLKRLAFKLIRPKDIFIERALVPDNYHGTHIDFLKTGIYGSGIDSVANFGIDSTYRQSQRQQKVRYLTINASTLTDRVVRYPEWQEASWRVLNIDIEGLDESVIKDLDLLRLNCDVVAAECYPPSSIKTEDYLSYYVNHSTYVRYFIEIGYKLASVVGPTLIFVKSHPSY